MEWLLKYSKGIFKSLRAVAKAYNLPRSTLQHRLDGMENRAIAREPQQRLTSHQESLITDWILNEDNYGRAPSIPQVRDGATQILRQNNDHQEHK